MVINVVCVQWFQSARDVPTLLRHCIPAVISRSGLEWMFRFRFIMFTLAALIYLVIPFDLIPEMLLGIFGLIDDFLIIAALAVRICIEYRLQVALMAGAAAAAGLRWVTCDSLIIMMKLQIIMNNLLLRLFIVSWLIIIMLWHLWKYETSYLMLTSFKLVPFCLWTLANLCLVSVRCRSIYYHFGFSAVTEL